MSFYLSKFLWSIFSPYNLVILFFSFMHSCLSLCLAVCLYRPHTPQRGRALEAAGARAGAPFQAGPAAAVRQEGDVGHGGAALPGHGQHPWNDRRVYQTG